MNELIKSPVIIIGAGRSGTNILRDILTKIPGFATWPCDEINYIWRHGNRSYPTDELEKRHARPEVKTFIRKAFVHIQSKYQADAVVEKTCANSLRVNFVREIFPTAKFIHITRDGREVVSSAIKRWHAELDLNYIWKKALYVPKADVPYYTLKYLKNRLDRIFSSENRLSTWGPVFDGMHEIAKNATIEETCAFQWKRCLEKATSDLSEVDENNVHKLHYRDLILNPDEEIEKLLDCLGVNKEKVDVSNLASMLHADSLGKWETHLSTEQVENIINIIGPTLEKFDFKNKL